MQPIHGPVHGQSKFEVRGSALFHRDRLQILYRLGEQAESADSLLGKLHLIGRTAKLRFKSRALLILRYQLEFLETAGFISLEGDNCAITPLGKEAAALAYKNSMHEIVGTRGPLGEVAYALLAVMGCRSWSLKELVFVNRRRLNKHPYVVHPTKENPVMNAVYALMKRGLCQRKGRGEYALTESGLKVSPVFFLLWLALGPDEAKEDEKTTLIRLAEAGHCIVLLEIGYDVFLGTKRISETLPAIRHLMPGVSISDAIAARFEVVAQKLVDEKFFRLVSRQPPTYAPTIYAIGIGHLLRTAQVDPVWLLEQLVAGDWAGIQTKVIRTSEQTEAGLSAAFIEALVHRGINPEQLKYFWGMVEPVEGFMRPVDSRAAMFENQYARINTMRYEVVNAINIAAQALKKRNEKTDALILKLQTEALVEAVWLRAQAMKKEKACVVSTPACAIYAAARVAYKHGLVPNFHDFYQSVMNSRYDSTKSSMATLPKEFAELRRLHPVERKSVQQAIHDELVVWKLNGWIDLKHARRIMLRLDKTINSLVRFGLPVNVPTALDAAAVLICRLRLCQLESKLNNKDIDAAFIAERFGVTPQLVRARAEEYLAHLVPRKVVPFAEINFRPYDAFLDSLLCGEFTPESVAQYCNLTGRHAWEYNYERRRKVLETDVSNMVRGILAFNEFQGIPVLQKAALRTAIRLVESLFRVDVRIVSPYACAVYACTYVAFDNNLHNAMEHFYKAHLQEEQFSNAAYSRLCEICPHKENNLFNMIDARLVEWAAARLVSKEALSTIRERMHEVAEKYSRDVSDVYLRHTTLLDAAVVVDYIRRVYGARIEPDFILAEFGVSAEGITKRVSELGMVYPRHAGPA